MSRLEQLPPLPDGWADGLLAWDSVEGFYAADERRRRSGEKDYGVWWWDGEQGYSTQYRVSVVEATGDLFALAYRGEGRVILLGTVGGLFGALTGDVDVYEAADRLLAGWEEWCGAGNSLGWVLERFVVAEDQAAFEHQEQLEQIVAALAEARPYVHGRVMPEGKTEWPHLDDARSQTAREILVRVDAALELAKSLGLS